MTEQTAQPCEEKRFGGDMCMGILSTQRRSAELIATADHIILTGPLGRRYELAAENVERIEKARFCIWFITGMILGSIRIYHNVEGYPKRLMFSSCSIKADKLLEELGALGYNIISQ